VHTHAYMSPQFYAVVVNKAVTIFINHMYVCMYACMYVRMYVRKRQVTPSNLN